MDSALPDLIAPQQPLSGSANVQNQHFVATYFEQNSIEATTTRLEVQVSDFAAGENMLGS